jgi:tripartite-type tricarboxylate transporter receptor subunit TctC
MTRSLMQRMTLAVLGLSLLAVPAQAQDFPNRPITLMVGLAAGGITDITEPGANKYR